MVSTWFDVTGLSGFCKITIAVLKTLYQKMRCTYIESVKCQFSMGNLILLCYTFQRKHQHEQTVYVLKICGLILIDFLPEKNVCEESRDVFNPLFANPTKRLNTPKQFVGKSRRILRVCLTILRGWRSTLFCIML